MSTLTTLPRHQVNPGTGHPRLQTISQSLIGWYFASKADRVTATEADTVYRVRFADRGFLKYINYRCHLGVAKLYSIRSIMRIARRPQLGPRTTLPVGWSATCAAYWASCTLRASAATLSCIASLRCSATRCVSVTRGRARSLEEKVVGRAGEMCGLCAPGGGEL